LRHGAGRSIISIWLTGESEFGLIVGRLFSSDAANMKNAQRATAAKETPGHGSSGTVIEARFPKETDGVGEQRVPILIRFLNKKEKLWKANKRSWNWRTPLACREDLALTQ
jgi:hypothetical protein